MSLKALLNRPPFNLNGEEVERRSTKQGRYRAVPRKIAPIRGDAKYGANGKTKKEEDQARDIYY